MSSSELTVYVYGHYDSRGGTTAIVADDKKQADHTYDEELFFVSELWADGEEPPEGWEPPSVQDFLYKAVLFNTPSFDQPVDLEDEDGAAKGEVWCMTAGDDTFTPTDIVAYLMFVPAEHFDGPLERTNVGGVNIECMDQYDPNWRQGDYYKDKEIEDDGTVWALQPAPMVRILYGTPPSVHEFREDQEERMNGWYHPRWDDDAFSFVLMHAKKEEVHG